MDLFFRFFMLYLIIDVSRIQEFIRPLALFQLQKVLGFLAFLGLFLSPYCFSTLKARVIEWQSKALIFILFWMILSVPFSVWPGGSFQYLTGSLWKLLLMCTMVIAYGSDAGRIKKVIYAYLIGINLLAFACLFLVDLSKLGQDPSLLVSYDRNDIAMIFVISIAFAVYQVRSSSGLEKFCGISVLIIAPIVIIACSSRCGVLGLTAVLIWVYFKEGYKFKGVFISIVFLLVACVFLIGGDIYIERLKSIINPEDDYNVTSEVGRLQVWARGIEMMLNNPILGVGVAGYATADGQLAQKSGLFMKWSVAHNSFVQVGAELGLPGLAAYVYIILSFLKLAKTKGEYILGAWIGFIVSGFFLTMAFSPVFFFLFGISMAILYSTKKNSDIQL
jgi:O-antigen ligase